MSNVISFIEHKQKQYTDTIKNPINRYLLLGNVFIDTLSKTVSEYNSAIEHIESAPMAIPETVDPDKLFVRLPASVYHSSSSKIYFRNKNKLDTFLNQYITLLTSKYVRDQLDMYAIDVELIPQEETATINIVFSTNGIQTQLAMITIQHFSSQHHNVDCCNITFTINLPISNNQYENLDHIYTIQLMNYISNFISEHF